MLTKPDDRKIVTGSNTPLALAKSFGDTYAEVLFAAGNLLVEH